MPVALIVRVCLGVLLSAVFCLAVARIAAPSEIARIAPVLSPVRGQVRELVSAVSADQQAGGITGETIDAGRRLARIHPLDPMPYALTQLAEVERGDREAANAAALTALSFQPRNRVARMHLVNQLVSAGEFSAAIEQITLLWRIDRDGRDLYNRAIVGLAADPASHDAIEGAVSGQPPWKGAVLGQLVNAHPDAAFLQRLFSYWPERVDFLLKRFLEDGNPDAAYLTFLDALPDDVPITVPHDPGLEGLAGGYPFNWFIDRQYAEQVHSGGVEISYFGRGERRLLAQIFPFEPGVYRLAIDLEGDWDFNAARLAAMIRCLEPDSRLVFREELSAEDLDAQRFEAEVSHALDSCTYVRFTFNALPGAYPRTSRLRVNGVDVTAVAADET
ncbi:MAG: hypothetical protein AAFY85_01390 [Pseudomonadota bacterium]